MGASGVYIPHVQLLTLLDGQDQLIFGHKGAREEIRQQIKASKLKVARLEKDLERQRKSIASTDAARKQHERQLQDLETRIARTAAMEGVHNQKEYEAAQAALASLAERKGEAEEAALTAMMALEELRAGEAQLVASLASEEAAYQALRGEKKVAFDEHGEALAAATNERAHFLAELEALDTRVFAVYEGLLKKHGDRAITVAVGERCGFCHISLSPQHVLETRLGKSLHTCDHCGRYIMPPPPASQGA